MIAALVLAFAFVLADVAPVASPTVASPAVPQLMSPQWAVQACEAWNADPTLTQNLEAKWIKNDGGRGYKAMQMYRDDTKMPPVELRIADKGGVASCIYGGAAESALNYRNDYMMNASTEHWVEMGAGRYGPMKAMIFRRLHFKGPYGEAMGVMGPFGAFLRLIGKVPSVTTEPTH